MPGKPEMTEVLVVECYHDVTNISITPLPYFTVFARKIV